MGSSGELYMSPDEAHFVGILPRSLNLLKLDLEG